MQVHPGDQDAVGADAIEHAFARSRSRGEIGIKRHAGFGKRGLHFRHMHRVAPDHQLILARCDEIGGVARRMPEARYCGHAWKHIALSSNQWAGSFSCMTSSAFGNNNWPFDMSVSPAE